MENLLRGIPYVIVRTDNILITSRTDAEHLSIPKKGLQSLEAVEFHVKKKKMHLLNVTSSDAMSLSYRLDKDGIHLVANKVLAIEHISDPQHITEP